MRRLISRSALILACGVAAAGMAASPASAATTPSATVTAASDAVHTNAVWWIAGYYPQAGGGLLVCQSDGAAGALQGYWSWNFTCDSRYVKGYYALVVSK
jgi:hypothetical protein